ncbi:MULTISPECIES: alpha-L-fucosidase [Chryseobacterium]|uniref:alpha-L-fucosidase n=1 Tax=Chryseobacterium geocarposphaerae TaxID=1416776 RepID=A0ABU1L8Q1_9FLAO|nr:MULTISPECIES: alpha-L-fucosidase [Chryseobacterium]MDR6403104.1 alpha-L-fucosidase [Chryseobacterium geocarposphaerae]MDR6696659.1 alpha-L-fucosidase [Chryseobacterium ginsenosidimutans]
MKGKFVSILSLGLALTAGKITAQEQTSNNQKMEWFQDAKLGIFIHWGIYSVDGISESWAFFNNYINHENYMKQLNGFSASQYKPAEWVNLIKDSGAKYAVITTKHHDGVSLWDSKAEKATTIPKNSLAKKDVLSPFISELKKSGLKTGLYYSLPDWSHPYYDVNTRTKKRYDIKSDFNRWQNFINYYQNQLTELSSQYKPDLLWFDGDWEHTSDEWQAPKTLENLRKFNPNIIINSRLNHHGDYETPEQGIPVVKPQSEYWELCYTMNDAWGYQPFDQNYKTSNMMVRTLADVISMGGNLLLDIGPKADGTIPEKQVEILKSLARWTSKNSDAIYGTRSGLPFENYKGKSAFSKDGKKLFIYLEEAKDFTKIYGLSSIPTSAKILGDSNGKVNFKTDNNENLTLNFSNVKFDKDVTVVELSFSEKIKFNPTVKKENYTLNQILENKNTKSATYEIAEQLHSGNNIFNNSGLTNDGQEMKILKTNKTNPEIFSWISKHSEALFGTEKGLPNGHFPGNTALSKDRQTLYLFVEGTPTGPIALKGIKNGIARIRIVGEGSIIPHKVYNKLYWSEIPGIIYIDVPKERLDKNMTVIAVLLDKPIELYREKVGAIENNL